jgi:hypothetical protein
MPVLRRPRRAAPGMTAVAACLAAMLSGLSGPPGLSARVGASAAPDPARTGAAAGNRFCQGLGKDYGASAAAWAFCKGAQPQGPSGQFAHAPAAGQPVPGAPGNADAASPAEDVTPGGLHAYGQADTSIAASGPYVVEAWNDATGHLSACPSPKAQITGLGFSSNGGKAFTDLQGLPDANCAKGIYQGDPSVVAYRAGGHTYFYISSMFDPRNLFGPKSFVALAACQVTGPGGRASLRCGQPVIAAASTQCFTFPGFSPSCSFLDKPYLTIDPAHRRLYAAYTEFRRFDAPVGAITDQGAIEVSACDLGTPAGHPGPAGGTPAAPACEHGTPLHEVGKHKLAGEPYLTIQQPDDRRHCEYEGAYPAADTATGGLYVGYEYNWGSSFNPQNQCSNMPIQNVIAKVSRHCLALRAVSPCAGPAARSPVPITSISAAFPPGYIPFNPVNLAFHPNDFPRLAVSDKAGTVSMVWNDARFHPYGDILLQSFTLGSLHPVQHTPVVLDTPHHGGLAFMPAVRTATAGGLLDVTWYSRGSVTTTDTTVKAAIGVNPRAISAPRSNVTITSVASNWDHQTYDFIPNFGEYTDNTLNATTTKPYVGDILYVAWTDGRTGVPQPFEAHLPARFTGAVQRVPATGLVDLAPELWRIDDLLVRVAQPSHQGKKACPVECVDGAFAVPAAQLGQPGLGEVKAVHLDEPGAVTDLADDSPRECGLPAPGGPVVPSRLRPRVAASRCTRIQRSPNEATLMTSADMHLPFIGCARRPGDGGQARCSGQQFLNRGLQVGQRLAIEPGAIGDPCYA